MPPARSTSRRHRIVEAIKYRPDPLRILIGRELGRPGQIREKNRRQLPLLSRRGGGGPSGAAGEHDRPFAAVQPSLRGLAGVPGLDIAVGVVVRLVQADVPVAAEVRSAGAQSLNQASGEHRPSHYRVGQGLSLERVLTGAGGGQHRTAASVPGQSALQVQINTTLAAVGEGAAETAVQDENLTASPAIVKLVQQPGRRDARARQLRLQGIGGGEVEPATPVQHTVARQVHHHQVTDAAAGQEHIDLPPQLPLVLVDHPGDGEAANVRVTQNRGQVVGVTGRCPLPLSKRLHQRFQQELDQDSRCWPVRSLA